MSEPIDAVIPWVDGADPTHKRKLDDYLASLGRSRPQTANPTRFSDDGELAFCLSSIVRYAPWFRHLYIITDAQRPQVLDAFRGTPWERRVRVVDHRELFEGFEECLPTFNSRSISSLFWRIPGIAEQYVYFNDDFMLLRKVRPQDFFRDGRVVVHGRWEVQGHRRWSKRLARALGSQRQAGNIPTESRAQDLSARLAGFDQRCFRLEHCPYPMHRATLAEYFDSHPEMLREAIAHRLRDPDQLRPESLAVHLELARRRAITDDRLRLVQLKPSRQFGWRLRTKLRRADHDERAAFACVQSLDEASPEMRARLLGWLDALIGSLQEAVKAAVS